LTKRNVYLAILLGWISTIYSKFEMVFLGCLQLLLWQIIILYFQKCWNFHKIPSKGGGNMKKIRYHSALTAWTLIVLFSEIQKFWKNNCFNELFFLWRKILKSWTIINLSKWVILFKKFNYSTNMCGSCQCNYDNIF